MTTKEQEFLENLLGKQEAEKAGNAGFSAADFGMPMSANGRRIVKAIEAECDKLCVNSVMYSSVAAASRVRSILAAAGLAEYHPGHPKATRALCDAGLNASYIDAIDGNIVDLGSLDPLDIGFDLRVTKKPIRVPQIAENEVIRVVFPRSRKHPYGDIVYGDRKHICTEMADRGFVWCD